MAAPTYTVDAVTITGNTFKPAASAAAVNLPPEQMVFNGTTDSVEINPLSAIKDINLSGAFTVYALFKLTNISSETEGYHYVYTHNDQPGGKEVYLRLRYVKAYGNDPAGFYLQFGTWDGATNYYVQKLVPANVLNGTKWIQVYGIFDPDDTASPWQLYTSVDNESYERTSNNLPAYNPQPFGGTYFVGAHDIDTPGLERLFKGTISQVAVFASALKLRVALAADSNNNGYIGNPTKNAVQAYSEYISQTSKPLTYFDANKLAGTNPPPDYTRVPVRTLVFARNELSQTYYKFDFGGNTVELYNKDAQNSLFEIWKPIEGNDGVSLSKIDGDKFTDGQWAKAVSSPGNAPQVVTVGLSVSKNAAGGDPEVYDEIKLYVQEAPVNTTTGKYDWIVPSGWKISLQNAQTLFATPVPSTSQTIGPMTEGSGWLGSDYDNKQGIPYSFLNPRGDCISLDTYENGFTLTLKYSYDRVNTDGYPLGYVRPDKGISGHNSATGDEKYSSEDRQQLDFFGNSGVKFFGEEIQIFDMRGLGDGLNIVNSDVVAGRINDKPWAGHGKTFTWMYVCNAVSGYLYNGRQVMPSDESREMLSEAYFRQQQNPGNANTIVIEVTKVPNTNDQYSVESKVLNAGTNVYDTIRDGLITAKGTDKHVFLQSHWGSGVVLQVISLVKK
ncbi:MAG: hypothetical protein LBU65_06810 [Planctomycetaceae bacterium]|jgi:hypothetical protein|nr:hypothetical protein [Planctomycetaceae bacterium]